jgi:hypothetical protein
LVFESKPLWLCSKGDNESIDGAVENVHRHGESTVGKAKADEEKEGPRRSFSAFCHDAKDNGNEPRELSSRGQKGEMGAILHRQVNRLWV